MESILWGVHPDRADIWPSGLRSIFLHFADRDNNANRDNDTNRITFTSFILSITEHHAYAFCHSIAPDH